MGKNNIIQPSILSGFMELLPREQIVFNRMLETIKQSFEIFGFAPLDTPIIERAEILLAKAGKEATKETYQFKKGSTELALRFDLTVPLARYVSQHFHELAFPFKRYQIGKVFRGEKSQRGRFREFYQCDIDIVGHGNLELSYDAEILSVTYHTFNKLGLGNFIIRVNNRKILSGFLEEIKLGNKLGDVMRAIDKIEKIGETGFKKELYNLGVEDSKVKILTDLMTIDEPAQNTLARLASMNVSNNTFVKGVNELSKVTEFITQMGVPETYWKIDLSIARGLEYYTGTVYETVLVEHPEMGSICSGGRYDNLAEYFSKEKLPGVGISIGLTRLFDLLDENNLLKTSSSTLAKILLISLTDSLTEVYELANKLRQNSIQTDVYEDGRSLRDKLDYANKLGVAYVGILGGDELKEGTITVKNMVTGDQETIPQTNLVSYFQ